MHAAVRGCGQLQKKQAPRQLFLIAAIAVSMYALNIGKAGLTSTLEIYMTVVNYCATGIILYSFYIN